MPDNTRPAGSPQMIKTAASVLYEPGDLLSFSAPGVVSPASSQADQLTAAANQELFAANFAGVSNGKKLASNTGTDELPVMGAEVEQIHSCASTTWVVGDLVGAVEAGSGTALEDQVVAKVTDPALAIGVCVEAGASLTKVKWRPFSTFNRAASMGGTVQTARKRFSVAQVNAGATLLPARQGIAYRMVSCNAISVGGAAAAVTTVDVLGTVTTARKLVAFAQASLTQSAVLKDGGTGGTVLADGASYTANDVSTAITVGKTGSDVTTATHIDIHFNYVAERA